MELRPGVSFEDRGGIAVFPVDSEHARAEAQVELPMCFPIRFLGSRNNTAGR